MLIYRNLCPQNQETCCEGSKVREYSYDINFAICQKTQAFFYNLVLGSGKGEEEGRGRRDKKRRNVTGEGHTGGEKTFTYPPFYLITAFNRGYVITCVLQVPDSSQVTAVATQPPVAVWLTICFQPSGSIKSLLHSSINTVSAARDSNSWVDLLTCPYADGQGVFVTTRFNRKCVLTGGNTAVTSLKQWTSLGASAM